MFMKSFRRVIIAAVLIFSFPIWSFASNGGPTITINGSKLNLTGVIQNGQLLVPLEELIQALGGSYIWISRKDSYNRHPGLSWPPGAT